MRYLVKRKFENIPEADLPALRNQLELIINNYIPSFSIKASNYFNILGNYYDVFLKDSFKENKFSLLVMENELEKFTQETREYFYLQIIYYQNDQITTEQRSFIKSKIKNGRYLTYYNKRSSLVTSSATGNTISNELRQYKLYTTKMKTVTFGSLFNQSKTPYLIFDFCGSWCSPCIAAIDEYAKNKKLDTSRTITPIWLFFENDTTSWFKIIKKYNLKIENCYLVTRPETGKTFGELFGKQFDWAMTFPFYSVFYKTGSIHTNNAPSFHRFEITALDILPKKNFGITPPVKSN